MGIKDSVFEASSSLRHAAELNKSLICLNGSPKEILLLYCDGGLDHRVNYASVQLQDLDAIIVVCTLPGHGWKNPADYV